MNTHSAKYRVVIEKILPGKILPVCTVLSLVLFLPVTLLAATLVVGGDSYQTIGTALEDAVDGDLIEVRGGEYTEKLHIDKTVHLKGTQSPIIHVDSGTIVEISSSGVVFEGFTLTYDTPVLGASDTAIRIVKGADGVTIRNNRLEDVMFGIWNVEGRDLRIEGNTIIGLTDLRANYRGNCINLTGSQRVHAVDNRLSDCRDGIYMELCHDATITGNLIRDSRYSVHTMWVDRGNFSGNEVYDNLVGLAIMYTKNSEIRDNLSYGNKTHGLLMIQAVRGEVSGNRVIGNTKGIFLYNSVYNRITSNLIMNNQLGLHSWGGSEENVVDKNSFINNELQIKYVSAKDQIWDGNYWSDYLGWDTTGDGIGDYPYESNSIVDHIIWRYPLAKVLYSSPSLQMLWMLEKQFPLFDVPKVMDSKPRMVPLHDDWDELMEAYSVYKPERIYGDIEKLDHVPGGDR
jgi:nitrous oxidase accessory protein